MITFENSVPIVRVSSLSASLAYYTKVLGFKIDWKVTTQFASISRGNSCLYLSQGDQGNPGSWFWLGVSDCEAVYREYLASGALIRNPPTNYAWALEMQVEDLDGNVLRIGSEPREDIPIGEWLDGRGVRWAPRDDGGWIRVKKEEPI